MFPDMTERRLLCSPTCGREWAVALILLSVLGLLYELFCFNLRELQKSPGICSLMRLPMGYTCLGGHQSMTMQWKFYKKYQIASAEKKVPFFVSLYGISKYPRTS